MTDAQIKLRLYRLKEQATALSLECRNREELAYVVEFLVSSAMRGVEADNKDNPGRADKMQEPWNAVHDAIFNAPRLEEKAAHEYDNPVRYASDRGVTNGTGAKGMGR